MSLRRIGSREYSLAMASRTILLTIASVLVGALGSSSSLFDADESGSSLCLIRRRAFGVDSVSEAAFWG
jgi:hypothetical protein